MPRDQSGSQGRQVTFDDVQIGTADAARDDPQQNMAGLKLRTRHIFDAKMLPVGCRYSVVHGCSHRLLS
jgi:hypothetical protein